MGPGGIGVPGLIIILIVALVLFGPKKLPELGRAFGRTLREFKEGTKELMKDDDDDQKREPEVIPASTQPADQPATTNKNNDKRLPE